MKQYVCEMADALTAHLRGEEVFLLNYSGEASDFVRLNRCQIRQAGHVEQHGVALRLIRGERHVSGSRRLTCDKETDWKQLGDLIKSLREKLAFLPEDPHLLYATEVQSTEQIGDNHLPSAEEAVDAVLAAGAGQDLVGLYAAGGICHGFANSLGQRNWYASNAFNLDWSLYHQSDKAVKSGYAGFVWRQEALQARMSAARADLEGMKREPVSIPPGRYRVYMAPAAVEEFVGMLNWSGFGLKSHRTKQTSLIRMVEEGTTLHPEVTLKENTKDGVAPNFQSEGFLKPAGVTLIEKGRFKDCLVSARSAKEYNVPGNGAGSGESASSLDMAAGTMARADVLARLGTGVYMNNLWYLNYSDLPACRITGMTRFACFWVEDGEIKAPVNVMRFDETLYRAFGENLLGLTQEREMILNADTYGGRSTSSARLPGALIEDFNFNL